jgi:NadR type nicotinamide-nucleotide adenylyltransferase
MTANRSLGVVAGKFLPPHHGHSYLLESAQAGADDVLVIVCARDDDLIPAPRRAELLRELHPAATVVVTPDDIADAAPDATSRAWARRSRALALAAFGRAPDVVFSSEEYGHRYARHLGARHVSVDPARIRFPVSGTAVRADPWRHRAFLAPGVLAWFLYRVCVLGAESTGTTTLAQDLAEHYGCSWVPEYGRAYCEQRGGTQDWRSDEFTYIAQRQTELEEAAARTAVSTGDDRLLVCDTDALATSIWHERYLGVSSPAVAGLAAARQYALHILTSDDIPFVQDGTRDGEHLRGWMTGRFREVLAARGGDWIEVRGNRSDRLRDAVRRIDALVDSSSAGPDRRPTARR